MEPNKHDLVLSMAAYAGYRAIGLSYDNTIRLDRCVIIQICGDNCHGKVREEAILGTDTSNLLTIEKADSVMERLYSLLAGLYEEDISDGTNNYGWDSYFVPLNGAPELSFNNIVWNKIIISGFSQGAGHAALIAKEVVVEGLFVIDGAMTNVSMQIKISNLRTGSLIWLMRAQTDRVTLLGMRAVRLHHMSHSCLAFTRFRCFRR